MTTISVRIDASQAKSGAQEFRRSGEEIKQTAAEIDCAVTETSKSLVQLAANTSNFGRTLGRLGVAREFSGLIRRAGSLRELRAQLELVRGPARKQGKLRGMDQLGSPALGFAKYAPV